MLIRHLWQLETFVFLQRCLLWALLFDNSNGGSPNFSSPNPLEVENAAGDYLAMENWENVKSGKKDIPSKRYKKSAIFLSESENIFSL